MALLKSYRLIAKTLGRGTFNSRLTEYFTTPFTSRYQILRLCHKLSSQVNSDEVNDKVIFAEEMVNYRNKCERGGIFLDFTFGAGGHTRQLLEDDPDVKVIAIDRDPWAQHAADELKQEFPNRLQFLNIKFSDVVPVLSHYGVSPHSCTGAVLDAGASLAQLSQPHRGFCDTAMHPLDMRMDGATSNSMTALQYLQHLDERSLYRALKTCGQSKHATKISRALMQARYEMVDIRTPKDLITVLKGVLMGSHFTNSDHENKTPLLSYLCNKTSPDTSVNSREEIKSDEASARDFGARTENALATATEETEDDGHTLADGHIHSAAASTFLALRMLVNDEINELDCGIRSAHFLLKPNAPFSIITYNNIEDAIAKRHLKGLNIDASPNVIGKPRHRYAKDIGINQMHECLPWKQVTKHVCALPREVQLNNPFWKNAELRIASANPDVEYDVL